MSPAAWGAIGSALSDAGLGLMEGLAGPSWAEEKAARARKAREEELKVEDLGTKLESERQQLAAGGKPIQTQWGLYTIDPTTRRYKLELPRPDQPRKPFAKEAELELMLDWSTSDDPYKQDIAKSYLDKQQAPGRQVDIRSRTADAQVQHLQRQQDYWQQRADEARRHNSQMEGIYRRKAEQVSGELGSLVQAQEWIKSGTPEQKQAAERYLEGKDVRQEKAELSVDTARERLEQLKTRSQYLDPKLAADLELRLEQVQQLKARGERLGPFLDAQIKRLEEQIVASQDRRNKPGGGSGSEVTVPHGPTGPSTRYRGADVQRYNEGIREGVEALTPLNEKEATELVTRQPPGPKRDGYEQAWRSKFPGKVFRPTPNITPFPEPRRPASGRRGDRDRERALTQPDTALDTQAKERFGKKWAELDEDQKVELEGASGTATIPKTQPLPALGPAPKPGTPEHRAYTTYKAELPNVPQDQALEAWDAVRTSGTTAEKAAFRRAFQEHFKEELR